MATITEDLVEPSSAVCARLGRLMGAELIGPGLKTFLESRSKNGEDLLRGERGQR